MNAPKKRARDSSISRLKQHPLNRPYTTDELVQVLEELKYFEQHGRYSPTASLRVRIYARRIRRIHGRDPLAYEEKKQRLEELAVGRVSP